MRKKMPLKKSMLSGCDLFKANFRKDRWKWKRLPNQQVQEGDLGYLPVNENKMLPEFEKAVAKLKVNEISKPVKTKYGYHILKITDKKGESYKTLESVKESIREELRNKRMYEILQKYMEKRKKCTQSKNKYLNRTGAPVNNDFIALAKKRTSCRKYLDKSPILS